MLFTQKLGIIVPQIWYKLMKINLNPLTETQIQLLKKSINLAGISRKHNISTDSNYIYKIMKSGAKNVKSKGYKILKELTEIVEELENKQ